MILKYWEQSCSGSKDQVIENPSLNEIHLRIKALDAETNSDLTMIKETAEELTIGGGKGHYVVSVLYADGINATLVCASAKESDETIEVTVGSQPSLIPRKHLVTLEEVFRVASAFCNNEDLRRFHWE